MNFYRSFDLSDNTTIIYAFFLYKNNTRLSDFAITIGLLQFRSLHFSFLSNFDGFHFS